MQEAERESAPAVHMQEFHSQNLRLAISGASSKK